MEVTAETGIFSLASLGHCKADLGCRFLRPLHLQGSTSPVRPPGYPHGACTSISILQPQQHLPIFVHTMGSTSSSSHQKGLRSCRRPFYQPRPYCL